MRKTLVIPALLIPLLLMGGALAGLLYTETGLQWGFRIVQSLVPGKLTAQLGGRLAGPLTVAGLRYEDTTMTVTGGNVDFDWAPARLLTGRIRIKRLEASDLDIVIRRPSAVVPDNLQEIAIPVPVTVVKADIHRLRVRLPGRTPLVITRLETRASAGEAHVALDRLLIEAPLGTVKAAGRIPLRLDGALQLETDWHTEYKGRPLEGQGTITGTLLHIRSDQRLIRPTDLRIEGQIDTDTEPPRWRVDAEADPFSLTTLIPGSRPAHISHGRLHAEGQGESFRAGGGFHVEDEDYGAWSVTLTGTWDGSRWRVPSFTAASTEGSARIAGSAAQRSPGTQEGHSDYQLDVEWTNLAWPPRGVPEVASAHGRATLSGTPDDYRVHTDAALRYGTFPDSTLTLDGRGDRSRLTLDEVRMAWLDGTWDGRGALAWTGVPDWTLNLNARDVNPATLHPGADGRLNGTLALEGRGTGSDFHVSADVTRLSGRLLTRPVTGNARFAADADGVTVSRLELHSGAAELRGSGRLGTRWEVHWRLQTPDLSPLYPDLSGRLSTRGEASGTPGRLRIDAELEADELAYRRSSSSDLTVQARIDLGGTGPWHIDLESGRTVIDGHELGRVSIEGNGSTDSHTINLLVSSPTHRFEQTVDGSFNGQRWQARLRDGTIEYRNLGRWKQADTAPLSVSRADTRLGQTCWDSRDARLCAAGSWDGDGKGKGTLTWENIDPALLDPWLEERQIRLAGRSHGALLVNIADAALDSATLALAMEDGRVSYPSPSSDEPHKIAFERATVAAVAGAGGLSADVSLVLNQTERISARMALQGWNPRIPIPSAAQPVEGNLALQLDDLSAVTLLIPDVLPRGARLRTNLSVSGTIGAPRFSGDLELGLEALAVARLGIVLQDLAVRGHVDKNHWQLQGAAHSGPGRVEIEGQGRVSGLQQWEGRFDVKGERFQALHLPTATVLVSPDIRFDIRPGNLAFEGKLRIPKANIAPQWSGETTTASEDVVIKGGEAPAAPVRSRRTHGTIELALGDEITIEGKGFEGRLNGGLRLIVHREGEVTAEGELRVVHGRYEAYGQKLEISQGRVLYAGGSIDNPAIDIIAKRKKSKVEVGIRVTGTVKRPVLELFSDPAMDDGDILSYLILGRPMNQANGDDGRLLYQAATSLALIGGEALAERIATEFNLEEVSIETGEKESDTALVLGKHLSPRLYIRYIQGLVDNMSAFQIRYQLNNKWSVETESGTSGAGADLLFTLEK